MRVLKTILISSILLALTGIAKAQTSPEVKRIFNYAEGLFSTQEYGLAREAYLKVLYFYPQNDYQDDALFKVGETYARQGNFWYAMDEWNKLIDRFSNSEFVPKTREKIKDAEVIVQQMVHPIVTVDERKANRYINWGYSFMLRSVRSGEFGVVYNKEEFNTSLYWFDKVINEFPNTELAAYAQYFKGELYIQQAKPSYYEKAVEEYQKVIDNYSKSHWADEAGVKIGDVYQDKIRSKKKAVAAYQKVVERYKSDPNSYYVSYAKTQIDYLK